MIAAIGPTLTDRLPKRRVPHSPPILGVVYSRDYSGLFRSHALANPKRPGERRVVVTGNCMVAGEKSTASLGRSMAKRLPGAELYWLAWQALTVSGQAPFLSRSLDYDPDALVWAVSLHDCRVTRGLFAEHVPSLAVRYGEGLSQALSNLRYLNWDNGRNVVYDLIGSVLPGERYIGVLQLSVPQMPVAPEPERREAGPARRVPLIEKHPPSRYPPQMAIDTLDELHPLVTAAGCQLFVTVLPHAYTAETYGAGTFEGFLDELDEWCGSHGATFVDLSSLVPAEEFADAVHFDDAYIPMVYDRVAEAVARELGGLQK